MKPISQSIPHDFLRSLQELFLRNSLSLAVASYLRLSCRVRWPFVFTTTPLRAVPLDFLFTLADNLWTLQLHPSFAWPSLAQIKSQASLEPLAEGASPPLPTAEQDTETLLARWDAFLPLYDLAEPLHLSPSPTRLRVPKIWQDLLSSLAAQKRTSIWLTCDDCPTWTSRAFRDLSERFVFDFNELYPFTLAAPVSPANASPSVENPFRTLGMFLAHLLTKKTKGNPLFVRQQNTNRLLVFDHTGRLGSDETFPTSEAPLPFEGKSDPFRPNGASRLVNALTPYRLGHGAKIALLLTPDGWRLFEASPSSWRPWPISVASLEHQRRTLAVFEEMLL